MASELSQLFNSLPRQDQGPTQKLFRETLARMPLQSIKSVFKNYRRAFTGEDAITHLMNAQRAASRDEGLEICQRILDAHLITCLSHSKDTEFRDKEKYVYAYSLKGRILLYSERCLSRSLDRANGGTAASEEHLEVAGLAPQIVDQLCKYQFKIFSVHELRDNKEAYSHFLKRLTLLPEVFVSEFSDHLVIQGLTGLSAEVKDRMIRLKNYKATVQGSDFVEWVLDNTNCETREQACVLGEVLLLRSSFSPVQHDDFRDHKDSLYQLTPQALRIITSTEEERQSNVSLNQSQSRVGSVPLLQKTATTNSNNQSNLQTQLSVRTLNGTGNSGSATPPQKDQDNTSFIESPQSANQLPSGNNSNKSYQLQKIIEDDMHRQLFHDFLGTQYCTENLDFYMAVAHYKALFKDKLDRLLICNTATEIWNTFLAGNELNVPHKQRTQLEQQISRQECGESMFDASQKHCFEMMLRDSLPKFVKTEVFKDRIAGKLEMTSQGQGLNNSNNSSMISVNKWTEKTAGLKLDEEKNITKSNSMAL